MQISFQRAIKITSDTDPMFDYKEHKLDPATMAVVDTMKGTRSSVYDKETSRKIGSFLRSQIGDYDRQTGIYARRIEGNPYIFTGEEARKAREINAQAKKELIKLEEEYAKGPDSSMPLSKQVELKSEKLHKIFRQNIFIRRDQNLLKMVEDGDDIEKPETKLLFNMDNNGKLKSIMYRCYKHEGDNFIAKKADLTI